MKISIKYVWWFLPFVVASFFVFHLFAIIGIFIALSYPIWWLLFPEYVPCIKCKLLKNGQKCSWCGRVISVNSGNYPLTINSVFRNFLVLFVMSLLSITFIFGETYVMRNLGLFAQKRTAYFDPPVNRQLKNGQIFPLRLEAHGLTVPINAAQVDLAYDPTRIQVVNANMEDSFSTIFIQKEIDNDKGFFRLTGGVPNPGYSGESAYFATVYFQAMSVGPTEIKFLPTSLIMANDGRGSNILGEMENISYLISSEKASEDEVSETLKMVDSQVLGVTSSQSQLIFYQDKPIITRDPQVLGEQDNGGIGTWLIKFWQSYNDQVISFWKRIAGFVFNSSS